MPEFTLWTWFLISAFIVWFIGTWLAIDFCIAHLTVDVPLCVRLLRQVMGNCSRTPEEDTARERGWLTVNEPTPPGT